MLEVDKKDDVETSRRCLNTSYQCTSDMRRAENHFLRFADKFQSHRLLASALCTTFVHIPRNM